MQKLWLITGCLFFLFVYHLKLGIGLKCYVCRSDLNETCESGDVSDEHSLECPLNEGRPAILCRKIHQKPRFKVQPEYVSIRVCGYEKGPYPCYYMKHLDLAYQETCECMTDNCNRARSHSMPDVLTIMVMFFLWLSF